MLFRNFAQACWRLLAVVLIAGLALWSAGRPRRSEAAPAVSSSSQASPLVLAQMGQYGGAVLSIAVQNGYAYVGRGPRLEIYNVSSPWLPAFVGRSAALPGLVEDVAVAGDFAYLAAGKAGLRVFNIAAPATPTEAAAIKLSHPGPTEVVAAGGILYVAQSGKLHIFSLANPAAPQLLKSLPQSELHGLTVDGAFLYTASEYGGVRVFDVSDPANPELIQIVPTAGRALQVSKQGNYLYVADEHKGLAVVDVTIPTLANLVAQAQTGTYWDVVTQGNHAYVAEGNSVRVLNVSNPLSPTVGASVSAPGVALKLALAGDNLFVAHGEGGLLIANLIAPALPTLLSSTGLAESTLGVTIANTLSGPGAFLANDGVGLGLLDVTNPATPANIKRTLGPERAIDVATFGFYAYVANGAAGLRVVNFGNPNLFTDGTTLDTAGLAQDVTVQSGHAYIADGANGLVIAGLSNLAAPNLKGHVDTPGWAAAVAVTSTLALVADSDAGLQIINIANPVSPSIVATYATVGRAEGVAVRGNHAFVVTRASGLEVVNIANPSLPVQAGYAGGGSGRAIALYGDYALVAGGNGGLSILNIQDPTKPKFASHYPTAGYAQGVTVAFGHVYVADGLGGLVVFAQLDKHLYLPLIRR